MDDTSQGSFQPETTVAPIPSGGVHHKPGLKTRIGRGKSITLEMPSEISKILNELMNQTGHDPEELFFLSLLLYKAAVDAKEAGMRMAIVDSDDEIVQNITGL